MAIILVTDNDSDYLAMAQEVLEERGHRVLSAEDGFQGLKLFKSKRPSMVITDLILPVLDGIELITAIRRIDRNIPVIVNLANINQVISNERLIEEYLVNKIFTKPINWHEFMETIQGLLPEPVAIE